MGSVCGLAPSPPSEVFLKTLPPPFEVNRDKYERFQKEEEMKKTRRTPNGKDGEKSKRESLRAPEPFYDIVSAACGHKHVVMLTREGDLITVGNNQYGQTAAPSDENEGGAGAPSLSSSSSSAKKKASTSFDWSPVYIDLDGAFSGGGANNRVACGANFSIAYQRRGRRVIAFGCNHMGQLGVGHKDSIGTERGLEAWDPTAEWWPASAECVVDRITAGFNHAVLQLTDGGLYGFGCNIWGELGIGSTTSPMHPTEIVFFREKGVAVKKVAVGNSVTLFLTEEGRAYGCGATNLGQLPTNTFEPVPIPLTREFQQGGGGEVKLPQRGEGRRLVRIKDVACLGSLCVYISTKNEILVQGSLPEMGVSVPAPRFAVVDQTKAIGYFTHLLGEAVTGAKCGGFAICELVPGPSTLLVRYANGCVAGLGVNTEGQLQSLMKVLGGRAVNLAPACASTELLPVFAVDPSRALSEAADGAPTPLGGSSFFGSGKGFNLLFDNDELYSVDEYTKPIELPPGERPPLAVLRAQKKKIV